MINSKLVKIVSIFGLVAMAAPCFGRTFGQDSRLLPKSVLNLSEQEKFSGVGQIECHAGTNRVFAYTAFLVGQGDTVVTVAHAFDYQKVDAQGIPIKGRHRHNPESCWFSIYEDGKVVDKVPIRFIMSRWDLAGLYEDPSEDIAVAKLARAPNRPVRVPGLAVHASSRLTLVSYHADIEGGTALRKVTGQSYVIPIEDFAMVKIAEANHQAISNLSNVYISDYDSDNNASGGPIYDAKLDKIVGIHMGSYEPKETNDTFNPLNNFNFGVYFNSEVLAFIMRVAATP